MSRLSRDAREISQAFDLLSSACENIQDHNACEDCPLHYMCLEDGSESVNEYADLMTTSSWDEFLEYADNAAFSEEDVIAQYADRARKADEEERGIDERYGY